MTLLTLVAVILLVISLEHIRDFEDLDESLPPPSANLTLPPLDLVRLWSFIEKLKNLYNHGQLFKHIYSPFYEVK